MSTRANRGSVPLLPALVFVAACAGPPKPTEPVAAVSSVPSAAPAATTAPTGSAASVPAAPVPVAPAGPPSVGLDDAPGKRERSPKAVLFFGMAPPEGAAELRLVPVVCSLDGKLATGKTCGLAMPATARVRMTRTDTKAPAILTVKRSTRDFRDDASERVYAAPTGPACCMYNTCVDETIPYLAPGKTVVPSRFLAVWPETAEVELKPQPAGAEGIELADGPWAGKGGVRIEQALRVGKQRLAAARGPCGSCGALWVDRGSGFAPVAEIGVGADGFDILGTTDVDADGNREVIVYEIWRNDHGLHVLGNDWSKPAYRFNCGNI